MQLFTFNDQTFKLGIPVTVTVTPVEDGPFATQEGTLYPLLSRLRRENLVDYEWRESEAGPPRKYYELTRKGISLLTELDNYWKRLTTTIGQLGK